MSWGEPLRTARKPADHVGVSASVRQYASTGTLRLCLHLSTALCDLLNHPKDADIRPGIGSRKGQIHIAFRKGGEFRLSYHNRKHGGGKFTIPVIDGVPENYTFTATPCAIVERTSEPPVIVVALPIAQWNREAS